jgi:anaerobic magnesium-protoporphyrin IX monomethyl ester cyclase
LTSQKRSVLLVFPKTGQDVYGINVGLPLGILSLATVLMEGGFDVQLVDERIVDEFPAAIRRAAAGDLLFVGISAKTGHQIHGGLSAAAMVRSLQPDVPLVWGGVHPTLVQDSTIRHPLVDIVCAGEGEATVVELARCLADGGDPATIPGLVLKRDGVPFRTPPRPLIEDLDTLPRPNYGLVDMDDYVTIGHILREPQLQLCTSRGCLHRCGYCYNLLFNERKFRFMSAERTFAEIEHLYRTFGVRSLFFYDDYFFGSRPRVMRLLELLEANPMPLLFEVSCRIDFIDRAPMELLLRLKKAGFRELLIGVESGDDSILKLMQKDFTVSQVLAANRKLVEAGIHVKYSFMAGFPGETEAQILETVFLMRRLLRENPNASVTPLGIFTPYPGTLLYERCVEAGMTNFPKSLEEWAAYNWIEARHSYLTPKQMLFLNRLNVMSRFFDRRAFERFGNRFLRPLVMAFFAIYSGWNSVRLRWRFFAGMIEVPLLNRMQQLYVERANRRLLSGRRRHLPDSRRSLKPAGAGAQDSIDTGGVSGGGV